MSSRVPLLPKGKSRKPSRLTIAPRAKPSTVDRSKRVATSSGVAATPDDQATKPFSSAQKVASAAIEKQATIPPARAEVREQSSEAVAPPVIPVTVARKSPVVGTTPAAVVAPVPTAKRAGGIPIGGSLSTLSPSATARKPVVASVTRSPIILPVQRHSDKNGGGPRVERLAKISGAAPLYRTHVSPVLGPRATVSAGHVPQAPKNGANPLVKRIMHKLDIKPHQSPRRAAVQLQGRHPRTESMSSVTNSPLLLAGRAPPGLDKGDENTDVLGEGVVGKHSKKRGDGTPNSKRQQVKRRKAVDVSVKPPKHTTEVSVQPRRQSLQRKAKVSPQYRDEQDSEEEPDDDQDEDVDPDDLELPEDSASIYVPARARATMWAKSLITDGEPGNENASNNEDNSGALVTTEKSSTTPRGRRKRSNSNASSVTSLVSLARNRKKPEVPKKELSQMTMGELALSIPKGRRMKRHEREEAEDHSAAPSDGKSSNLLNMNALKRVRSLSVSSESAALGGSLVTPQVQIIDGKMVIMESTIKLDEQLHHRLRNSDDDQDYDSEGGIPPRHVGPRLNSSHPNGPGRRWTKEETKQFYYCLSQVGPNFSMMATLFPKRKRKELKSKFKFEERSHPRLIEIALRASAAPLDSEMVEVIAKMVDKEAQRKLEQQKKRRRRSSSFMGENEDDDDDDDMGDKKHVKRHAEPDVPLPSVNGGHADVPSDGNDEVEEIVEDDDEYMRVRHDSFDFSG